MLLHRRTFVFSLIGLSIFVFLIVTLYSLPGNSKRKNAFEAIPDNAAMIIELKKPFEFWKECSENSAVYQQLLPFDFFSEVNNKTVFIDSLVSTNADVVKSISSNPLYISFHQNSKTKFSALFVIPFDLSLKENAIELIASNNQKLGTIRERRFEHFTIKEIRSKNDAVNYSFFIHEGLFICSTDKEIIEQSVRQINSGKSILDSPQFNTVNKTIGKNVHANIYINHSTFALFFAQVVSKESFNSVNKFKNFAQWTALDLTIKEDLLLFNGYSSSSDTAGNDFIGTFIGQTPQESSIYKIIPSSTSLMLCYGFSNFEMWHKNYIGYLKKNNYYEARTKSIAETKTATGIELEKELLPCIGNELALVITPNEKNDSTPNYYGIFKTSNLEKTLNLLKPEKIKAVTKTEKKKVVVNKKGKNGKTKKVETVKNVVNVISDFENIYEYKATNALYILFGSAFSNVSCKYYSIINDYIVFGNTPQSLKAFIENQKSNNTLSESPAYTLFSKNISEQSNIYLYANIAKASENIHTFASNNIQLAINNHAAEIQKFNGFAFQVKSDGKLFYNSACLSVTATLEALIKSLWSTKLDTLVLYGPQNVNAPDNKAYDIAVFDFSNNFYLIDKTGAVKHKIKINEKPFGPPVEIDLDIKGLKHYLFNTPSYLYIINSEGNIENGFPVKLEKPSTAALTVADYSNNNDYRFLIPCGTELMNYTKKGSINSGWNVVNTTNPIVKKVTVLKFAGNDCIAITDSQGKIYLVDRKGKEKIVIKSDVKSALFSKVFTGKNPDTKSNCLLTTNNSGTLVFIDEKGKTEQKTLRNFSSLHVFLYEDYDADNKKDYIFLDSNKLYVYNDKYTLTTSYNFPCTVSPDILILKKAVKKGVLGAYCPGTEKIYLLSAQGSISKGFPLKGGTSFFIESLSKNNDLNLVVGSGSTISNYAFE